MASTPSAAAATTAPAAINIPLSNFRTARGTLVAVRILGKGRLQIGRPLLADAKFDFRESMRAPARAWFMPGKDRFP